jgi:predicted Rossmann fold flavoprotein
MQSFDVVILGGGAAGFFCANVLMDALPQTSILILEKTNKTLQKVKISGGGRCNVTHNQPSPNLFAKNYPRGESLLKKTLITFGQKEMIEWLDKKGIQLKIEADHRIFPQSNDSQTIIDCFTNVLNHKNCQLHLLESILDFNILADQSILVKTDKKEYKTQYLVFAGGSSESIWNLLEQKEIKTINRVPSLFTFKFVKHPMAHLSGISLPNVILKVKGEKLETSGPWLITHQGISGPVVLKMSAFGARVLHQKAYRFQVSINFSGLNTWDEVNLQISQQMQSAKLIGNGSLFDLPKRLWLYLLERAQVPDNKKWSELSKKEINKLTEEVYQGSYEVDGKNTFKEEFVTAGGISLDEVDRSNFGLNKLKNCYAIGEILDIDGVTGGFNFQNCWTSAYLAANHMIEAKK